MYPFIKHIQMQHGQKARCADLLLGNGEVLGLGERHKTASDIIVALQQHNISPEPYDWYTSLRDKKEIKTSWFRMGIERFIAWIFST